MPSYVYREAPDVDFYCVWSTIVDAPVYVGDRAEILAYLERDSDPWLRDDAPHHPKNRLARADTTGTSAMHGEGAWDDSEYVYHQEVVSREDLFVRARAVAAGG